MIFLGRIVAFFRIFKNIFYGAGNYAMIFLAYPSVKYHRSGGRTGKERG